MIDVNIRGFLSCGSRNRAIILGLLIEVKDDLAKPLEGTEWIPQAVVNDSIPA